MEEEQIITFPAAFQIDGGPPMTYNPLKPMAKILVVEDDDANREFLRYVLENAGHRVRTVADGQAALDAVAAEIPELILLDVMLPEVHGYEVCHRLKGSPKTSAIKIMFLSAKTFPADRHQARAVGGDDFLSKPADPRALLARVEGLLKGEPGPGLPALEP